MDDQATYRYLDLAMTSRDTDEYPPPRYGMSVEEEAAIAAEVFAEEGADPADAFFEVLGDGDPQAGLALRPEALGLANDDYAGAIELAVGAQLDRDAQRAEEDMHEETEARLGLRPKSAEVILARALKRVSTGTYTNPAEPGRADAVRQLGGMYGRVCRDDWGNPTTDEFGRCAAAFHQPGCHTVVDAAATRDHDAGHQWRDALARNPMGKATTGETDLLRTRPQGSLAFFGDRS